MLFYFVACAPSVRFAVKHKCEWIHSKLELAAKSRWAIPQKPAILSGRVATSTAAAADIIVAAPTSASASVIACSCFVQKTMVTCCEFGVGSSNNTSYVNNSNSCSVFICYYLNFYCCYCQQRKRICKAK